MGKMRRQIFHRMFVMALLVLISSTLLTVAVVYRHLSIQYVNTLKSELLCIANGVDLNSDKYLDSLNMNHRITLIDAEGNVIYDSIKDLHSMENHKNRKEFMEAIETGEGFSERYSETMSKKTVNVAMLLKNGSVLRISDTLSTELFIVMDIVLPMFIVLIAAVVMAAFLAFRMSKNLTKPINEINLSAPDKSMVYEEMQPLIDKINEQNEKICLQMETINIEHEKQDHMRRDFTANVSHELKTPLTSISGFAEIIQNGLVKEEDITRFAGKIHDEAQRLIILVGDIIKLSQLDGKDIAVKMEPIDLYETCRAVMSHLEAAAEKKNVAMELKGSRMVITGAEQIIEEMIFNLVDNAIKYNRDGGTVTVTIEKNDDGIVLSVSDTGIGIPEEGKTRIFERFFRVDKSHSKNIGGTGLGLSIVKHGANYHNASVSVESKLGEGTTIKIIF